VKQKKAAGGVAGGGGAGKPKPRAPPRAPPRARHPAAKPAAASDLSPPRPASPTPTEVVETDDDEVS
jgi:hypothetical protein